MSHVLRKMQRPDGRPVPVFEAELPMFWLSDRLPTPQEQADSLILWIGDSQAAADTFADTSVEPISAMLGCSLSPDTGNTRGLSWLLTQLDNRQLYERRDANGRLQLRLTFSGWERYEGLKRRTIESRTAFMAMKFGEDTLNRMVTECFKPAVARAGFELKLLTDQQPAGLIDNQIRAAIRGGRFVVADLSHGNLGAYWEAGYAEGLSRPVIYTCERAVWDAHRTHFDTNHMMTVIWDAANPDEAGKNLAATIRATLPTEATLSDEA